MVVLPIRVLVPFQAFPLASTPLGKVVLPMVLLFWLHWEPVFGLYPLVIVVLPNCRTL